MKHEHSNVLQRLFKRIYFSRKARNFSERRLVKHPEKIVSDKFRYLLRFAVSVISNIWCNQLDFSIPTIEIQGNSGTTFLRIYFIWNRDTRRIFEGEVAKLLLLGEEESYNNSPGYVSKEEASTFTFVTWFPAKTLSH